ncbi:hypothetical protein DFQ26_000503, partial [Actinomortierella ambigua]
LAALGKANHNQATFMNNDWIIQHFQQGKDLFDRSSTYVYKGPPTDMPQYVADHPEKYAYLTRRYKDPIAAFTDIPGRTDNVTPKNIYKRKNRILDEVLLMWLMDQRSKILPVTASMIKEVGGMFCTILFEGPDSSDDRVPSKQIISASGIANCACRDEVVHIKLHGDQVSILF